METVWRTGSQGCWVSHSGRVTSTEQHRAAGALHQRKPASRQRGTHPAVQRRSFVEQARAGGVLSNRAGNAMPKRASRAVYRRSQVPQRVLPLRLRQMTWCRG